jgi:hypothetical protein
MRAATVVFCVVLRQELAFEQHVCIRVNTRLPFLLTFKAADELLL